ncbi:hypothetical protein S7711_09522 [Stachybotrys chartarum IBT 7711]|uniref:Uncharacterized protein n=1 Tax=Stachybotrys chartarum (strain CBS 109288 / IBT 7711) TaxID=1280523 RepID=A0A084BBB9_STACB|nr:hypothetical protein S7711_09522 [Stachybotrys chartarum IBT 7711]
MNLARAGYKTLLLEAGDDESADPESQILAWARAVGISESLSWSFWSRHYDDDELEKKYLHLTWRLQNGDLMGWAWKRRPRRRRDARSSVPPRRYAWRLLNLSGRWTD